MVEVNNEGYILDFLSEDNSNEMERVRGKAEEVTLKYFSNAIYIRGLIEISNHCRQDCYYCGIRRSKKDLIRYRLSPNEIVNEGLKAYEWGFRTLVLQGGEDINISDDYLIDIIKRVKKVHEDMRITLSLGIRPRESYKNLKEAGANRYLLRHETADEGLFNILHPGDQRLEDRINALLNLKSLGFQVGAGFLVGPPKAKIHNYIEDLRFLKYLKPQMVGIGPFIPAKGTPFEKEEAGSVTLTLKLLSLIRLTFPKVLLPATTALNTLNKEGRLLGIKHGCNVLMPNISPEVSKKNYTLYDNKAKGGLEGDNNLLKLDRELSKINRRIYIGQGDGPLNS